MADDDSSSELGGGGAMGFFDVVAPMVLNEVEDDLRRKKERDAKAASGGRVSLPASEVADQHDDSSSGDTGRSSTGGVVGLFDAMEGEVMPVVGGTELIDRKKFTMRHKAAHLTHSDSDIFKHSDTSVLSVLNYGEDKVVTHELDCIRVWDLYTKQPLMRFPFQVRRFKKYNHWLFCIDTDTEDILQLDLRDAELKVNRYTGLEDEATAIAVNNFVGSGVTLFAITRDSFSYSWKCPPVEAAGHEIEISTTFQGHTQNVTSLDLGDQYLYTSSTDKTVRVWNYENGKCVQTLSGHEDWVFSVKVIGNLVYSGSRDETVRVWNDSGECVNVIKLGALAYGVLLEGAHLYIRDAMKRVVICEAQKNNKIVGIAEGSTGAVNNIIVYKNVMVTCAADDKLVRVWSASDGALLAVLKGHNDGVNGIALFGAGIILSASEDGNVRQWDLKTVFDGLLASDSSAGGDDLRHSSSNPARMKLSGVLQKTRSSSIFSKPRSASESKVRKERGNSLFMKSRSDSTGAQPRADEVTPAVIASFRTHVKPILKTQKVKGQFYPSSFTGKDLISWIKANMAGCDSTKNALLFAASMHRAGAFEVVSGKSISDSASCILKLT